MDGLPIAGLHINRLNVHVGLEVSGYDELPIFVFTFGADFVFDRHFSDPIGFTECPAFREFRRRWDGIEVASGCAGFCPVGDHLDVGVRETAFVFEVAIAGGGFPGGHEPRVCVFSDFGCPDLCVVIVGECKGCDFALSVTGLAILLEYRGDVFAIGDLRGEPCFGEMERAAERRCLFHGDCGIGRRCEECVS